MTEGLQKKEKTHKHAFQRLELTQCDAYTALSLALSLETICLSGAIRDFRKTSNDAEALQVPAYVSVCM